MNSFNRISWHTNVKHYIRSGLFQQIPSELAVQIPASNIRRWKNEPENKYKGSDVQDFIEKEIEFLKRTGEFSSDKKVIKAYLKLSDTFRHAIAKVKGVKQLVSEKKELIVNTIEDLKNVVSVDDAIAFFGISRATYQNYKSIVINKCESSYFMWCVKKYPHQLLRKEILTIKEYMTDPEYKHWSKSSVYLKALRDDSIAFSLTSWYKYCKLLGFTNRHLQKKKKYKSLVSHRPNQYWCADVTIYKTLDNQKHYIHFLMDHYSKKILGYTVEKSSSGIAIKKLLEKAYLKYEPDLPVNLLTDGGSENVNQTVKGFLDKPNTNIIHLIAQKDITFSNSAIEALNKVIKHQFLLPLKIPSGVKLETYLQEAVFVYNTQKPQFNLAGNTPKESFTGINHDFSRLTTSIPEQKKLRLLLNQQNQCKKCLTV